MAVIALPGNIQIQAKTVHAHLLGACQSEPAAGGVSRIVDVEWFPAAVTRRNAFDLERDDVRDDG